MLEAPTHPYPAPTTLTLILLPLFTYTLYTYLIHPLLISPLSRAPAPHWSCHISPLWLLYTRFQGRENRLTYAAHQRYGKVVRLAPDTLSFSCFEGGLKQIYLGGMPRSVFYERGFVKYGKANIFTMQDMKEHAARRKMFAGLYTKSAVLASESVRAVNHAVVVDRLLPFIQENVDRSEPVDMLELGYSYSMDSFVNWQFGLANGCNLLQNEKERRKYLDGFFGAAPYMFYAAEMPKLTAWLERIRVWLVPKDVQKGLADTEDWNIVMCDRAVRAVRSGVKPEATDGPVVLEQALRTMGAEMDENKKTSTSDYPQRLEIAGEMYTHNSAAHETSGNTLGYLFYELSCRSKAQNRLRAELRSLNRPIDYPSTNGSDTTLPSAKEIEALPFLEAVIMETLRLYPSVPGPQPRVTPEQVSLSGIVSIPAGTVVQCNAYTLHRNADVFSDPEMWNPDRWIEASSAQLHEMRRWFWAFGSGPSMCIGLHFAMMSVKLATAAIYSNYETAVNETGDMELGDAYIAGPRGRKISLTFQRRKKEDQAS